MPATHLALLRGINVGGNNQLPMSDLRALFLAAGCRDARTYIQSGNVLFSADDATAETLPSTIAEAITAQFGLRVPVVIRTAAQLGAVIRDNPYLAVGADPATLHVYFLADTPDATRVARLTPDRSPPDEFTVRGQEVYLRLPAGMARTKLTNAYFDSQLATVSTARNWRTVTTLYGMLTG